jgi:hypothetical protein
METVRAKVTKAVSARDTESVDLKRRGPMRLRKPDIDKLVAFSTIILSTVNGISRIRFHGMVRSAGQDSFR